MTLDVQPLVTHSMGRLAGVHTQLLVWAAGLLHQYLKLPYIQWEDTRNRTETANECSQEIIERGGNKRSLKQHQLPLTKILQHGALPSPCGRAPKNLESSHKSLQERNYLPHMDEENKGQGTMLSGSYRLKTREKHPSSTLTEFLEAWDSSTYYDHRATHGVKEGMGKSHCFPQKTLQ